MDEDVPSAGVFDLVGKLWDEVSEVEMLWESGDIPSAVKEGFVPLNILPLATTPRNTMGT